MKTKQTGSGLLEGLGGLILAIIVIAVIGLVIWGLARASVGLYRDVAPRQAEAEREVYVNTPQYINGKNQIIAKYMREYKMLKPEQETERGILRSTILNEASTVDTTKLQPEIQSFIRSL